MRSAQRRLPHAEHLHFAIINWLEHHTVILVGLHLQIHDLPERKLHIALELGCHILPVCKLYLHILPIDRDDLSLKCITGL